MFNKYMLQRIFLVSILLLILASACGNKSNDDAKESGPTVPVETNYAIEETSPVLTPVAAVNSPFSPPPPTAAPEVVFDPVILDEPIKVGDTSISGTGPANVPIEIYEVANTADLLGETTIGDDGAFSISFDRPLRETERIGVTLGDLTGTPFEYIEFKQIAIRDVPTYGYILADVSVQP